VTDVLGPGEQRRIGDVLSWLREKGLAIPSAAEEAQQGGTLLVRFDGAGAVDPNLVSATARTAAFTSSPQPAGRAGLAYSGLLSGETQASPVTVYGLRSTPTDRTNLAVFNSFIAPVTVKVTVCSGSGDGRCVLFRSAETLPPLGWVQYGSAQLLDANGIEQGWAVVESTSSGSFGAYAVVNDNVTNDGSFVLPGGGPLMGSTLIVPVLVETGPFRSELTLANQSPNRVTLSLKYVESMTPSTGHGGTVSLALEPFEQRIIPEAIDFLRRNGASIGPPDPYPNHGGALRVTASGAEVDKLFAGARTSAKSTASTGGQFGLFTPGVYPGQTASTEAYLYGLRRDAENRTNVAVVNAGSDSDGPIGIVFEVFDADDAGRPKAARYGYWAIAPGEWEQIDNIFRFTGVSNGWVKVTRTSGTAPWFAYAVVNDGGSSGERTGDGAYVPMVK
jgi:hypothetical protein